MDTINKLKAKLAEYPHISYSETAQTITVRPIVPSGFMVTLHVSSNGFLVEFDNLHEEFKSEEEEGAIQFFGFGLSDACRLAITYRGSFASKWVVESQQVDGSWIPVTEMGLLLFPFWRGKRVEYKQNHLIAVG